MKLDPESEIASTVPGGTNIPETSEGLDVDLDKTASVCFVVDFTST